MSIAMQMQCRCGGEYQAVDPPADLKTQCPGCGRWNVWTDAERDRSAKHSRGGKRPLPIRSWPLAARLIVIGPPLLCGVLGGIGAVTSSARLAVFVFPFLAFAAILVVLQYFFEFDPKPPALVLFDEERVTSYAWRGKRSLLWSSLLDVAILPDEREADGIGFAWFLYGEDGWCDVPFSAHGARELTERLERQPGCRAKDLFRWWLTDTSLRSRESDESLPLWVRQRLGWVEAPLQQRLGAVEAQRADASPSPFWRRAAARFTSALLMILGCLASACTMGAWVSEMPHGVTAKFAALSLVSFLLRSLVRHGLRGGWLHAGRAALSSVLRRGLRESHTQSQGAGLDILRSATAPNPFHRLETQIRTCAFPPSRNRFVRVLVFFRELFANPFSLGDPAYFAIERPASDAALADFEQRFGVQLPEEVIRCYKHMNGSKWPTPAASGVLFWPIEKWKPVPKGSVFDPLLEGAPLSSFLCAEQALLVYFAIDLNPRRWGWVYAIDQEGAHRVARSFLEFVNQYLDGTSGNTPR